MVAMVAIYFLFAGVLLLAGLILAIVACYHAIKAGLHIECMAFLAMIFTVSIGLGVMINTTQYLFN